MKRALIISYYWPPSGGSGVQRWVKFAKYLPEHGWQPVIYTPKNPELIARDTTLASEVPATAEIVQRRIVEPYAILHRLRRNGSSPKTSPNQEGTTAKNQVGEVNPINSQKKSLGQKIMMFIRGNFFIPDPRCWWIRPSVKFLEQYLKEHPVDIIISTGPPHSMHLIAKKLAKKTGLPWVADFRDPWTKMFYFKHLQLGTYAKWRHARLEQSVLDTATTIVAVSPLVQEDFRAMTKTPVELITNGYDEDDFTEVTDIVNSKVSSEERFFNVTHTGLFANDGNPEVIWKVLSEMCGKDEEFKDKLRIRLCGKTDKEIIDSICEAGLNKNLVDLGYQNHKNAVAEQKKASVLILPLRKEPEYKATLPGKLFEYLAAGRPVLGIGQTDGAMARILADTCSGETYEWNDEAKVRVWFDKSWADFKAGKLSIQQKDIHKYSRSSTAASMAKLLNKLTK